MPNLASGIILNQLILMMNTSLNISISSADSEETQRYVCVRDLRTAWTLHGGPYVYDFEDERASLFNEIEIFQ